MTKISPSNTESRQRRWTLFLYSITSILLFADQNLLSPNLSAVADEFHFSKADRDSKLGGDIALAFFLLGAPASFVIGYLADSDKVSRSKLFAMVVILGEGACLFTYFTTSYRGLYITRALTGLSIGGAWPLLSSILGDWYPPEMRGKIMAFVGIGVSLGISLGQSVSGFLGPSAGWRMPFLVIGTPALMISCLILCTVVDPVRGASETRASLHDVSTPIQNETNMIQHHKSNLIKNSDCPPPDDVCKSIEECANKLDHPLNENIDGNDSLTLHVPLLSPDEQIKTMKEDVALPLGSANDNDLTKHHDYTHSKTNPFILSRSCETVKDLLRTPTVLLVLFQGAPGCIPWSIIGTFLNDYLSDDCGMSIEAATAVLLIFSLGNFLGTFGGGYFGDYLYKKDSRYPNLLSGFMAIFGVLPMWILINVTPQIHKDEESKDVNFGTAVISFLAGVSSCFTGPISKATLQNVTTPHTRGQAFAILNMFDDLGKGLGPVFVAILIRKFQDRCMAFNIGLCGWIICGIFNLSIFYFVKNDEDRIRKKIYHKSV